MKEYTGVRIDSADYKGRVLVTWINSPAVGASGSESNGKTRLVRASSGEIPEDDVGCIPSPPELLRASPNGEHSVTGPVHIAGDGEVECVGGGDGQKSVALGAVSDDGIAYGFAGDTAIRAPVNGEIETEDGADRSVLVLGIMQDGVAVHEKKGPVTGNPVG